MYGQQFFLSIPLQYHCEAPAFLVYSVCRLQF